MSNIFNKLNDLKGKLANLELDFESEIKKEEKVEDMKGRLEKKLPLVIKMQNSKLKLDIGNEIEIITTEQTILNFPFKLNLKEEILSSSNNIKNSKGLFIDSSKFLFSPIINIIRHLSDNPSFELNKDLIINCSEESLKVHAKEFFLEDTDKVLSKFNFQFVAPWERIKRTEVPKNKKNPNKWGPNDYILCYSCGSANDGNHWKKRCSYDRADDSYCISFYIATCLTCDPENTLTY